MHVPQTYNTHTQKDRQIDRHTEIHILRHTHTQRVQNPKDEAPGLLNMASLQDSEHENSPIHLPGVQCTPNFSKMEAPMLTIHYSISCLFMFFKISGK